MLALIVAVATLVALAGLITVFMRNGGAKEPPPVGAGEPEALGMGVPARGLNRPAGGVRRRRRRAQAAEEESEEDEQEEDEQQRPEPVAHRMTARDAYDARRAARDAERDAQEAAQEEEIRRAAEERRRREEQEAAKWVQTFTVEARGEEVLSQEEGQAFQTRFVEYIRRRKTVALEELAGEFGMRTQAVVKRVQALEADGAITGVMDDRGKFIFISPEEMRAFADFVRQRGRIAIAELAAKSNQFVDLEPREVAEAADLELPPAVEVGA